MSRHLRFMLLAALAGTLTLKCATPVAAGGLSPTDDSWRIAAARELMTRARYCALITVDENGQPQARTIDPSPPDSNLVVWFATNPATRKVQQIERDPRVTLYYFDERSPGYVSVTGTARVISDPETKQQRWLKKWTPFYPGGADTAVLYEVIPSRIEVVDISRGIVGDPETWTPPSVDLQR